MAYVIFVLALVALVVRLVVRARGGLPGMRRGRAPAEGRGRLSGLGLPGALLVRLFGDVGLVAGREVRERVRGRIFQVGTVLILLAVAAAIVIPVIDKGKASTQRVGLVGATASVSAAVTAVGPGLGASVVTVTEPDVATGDADLRAGRIDVLVLDGRVVVNEAVKATDTSSTVQLARAVALTVGTLDAYQAAGLSVSQARIVGQAKPLPVTSLQTTGGNGSDQPVSIVALVLVFIMLTQYNTWILTGVVEEKSSRVIEVLLAAVRPVQLLAGKVLGIGLVALAQATLIVVFALGLARVVGSDLLQGTAPATLVGTLVWLFLGYAFYCWVYAAAGSTATRQEQLQSLAFPLSIPLIVGYVVSITAASSGNPTTFFQVLAYLPPTAPFAMPVLVGLGDATWWQFTASALISIGSTIAVARLAAGIYRRAILRTGRRVRLSEVFARDGRSG
jgi:ABC-2 type transport system permease protein